jgi:monoamine oxidase
MTRVPANPWPRYIGKFAVLAMPPWLTGRVTFAPALPRQRNQVPQRTPMGAVVKVRRREGRRYPGAGCGPRRRGSSWVKRVEQ